nr:phage capsid protein [Thiofilum sp.]
METWRVKQFTANVYHLSQQKASVLAPLVRKETFKGNAEYFDRLGTAEAIEKTARNSDTPNLDIDHSRRMLITKKYEWATLVDKWDKLENIHNPESEYAIAARNAMGRKMDSIIIDSLLGVARSGESGGSSVILPNTQKLAAVSAGSLSGLNIQALRKAKFLLDDKDVVGKRYIAITPANLEALLTQVEVTSADYNSVKALVNGELNTFLGFEFKVVSSSIMPLAAAYNASVFKYSTTTGLYNSGGTAVGATNISAIAFIGDGVICGMHESMSGRVDERNDKSYSAQVYASMDLGGVRMEEEKVVQIVTA